MDKEMEAYAQNVNTMEDEMANKFTKTDELKAKHDTEKRILQNIRQLVG